ncbi:MAG: hypothetical protein HKN31_09100, partial [Pricia sp.]|nr:hypothetical protein [Pricia sp.]
ELLLDFGTPNEHIFLFNAREILRKSESDKRILLAIANITKRKKVEKDYLTTIEELGRTNEQLDQFVHVASHDLQEPLRKIMTFVNRITEGRAKLSEDDLEAYLNKIQSSSSRMSALIKNMLNYARLKDPGQLYERTDLNTVMADIIKDFELLIEQKGAELHIGELPTLDAMPLQINQLFYNLISNALKFSSEGVSPIISISSRRLTEEEVDEYPALHSKTKHHEIIVRDNGIGISPEYKEKIFNIFQRLNPSSQYLGTGIGLAICKEIVQNHQGTIFALSKEGEGTAFHVVLPSRRHASENRS